MWLRKTMMAVVAIVLVMISSLTAQAQDEPAPFKLFFVNDGGVINQSDLVNIDSFRMGKNVVYVKNGGKFSLRLANGFSRWAEGANYPGAVVNGNLIENIGIARSPEFRFYNSKEEFLTRDMDVEPYIVPSLGAVEIDRTQNRSARLPDKVTLDSISTLGEGFYTWRIESDRDLRELKMQGQNMTIGAFLINAHPSAENRLEPGETPRVVVHNREGSFSITGPALLELAGKNTNIITNPKDFVIYLYGDAHGTARGTLYAYYYGTSPRSGSKLASRLTTFIRVIDARPASPPPVEMARVQISAETGGSVQIQGKTQLSESYPKGTQVTVLATASDGYQFEGWYQGASRVSESLSYPFTLSSDVTLLAKFRKKVYTVHAVLDPASGGQITAPSSIEHGKRFTVQVGLNEGYEIDRWLINDADISHTGTSYEVPAHLSVQDLRIKVLLKKKQVDLTIQVQGSGQVLIDGVQALSKRVDYGTALEIKAIAQDGWRFDRWDGAAGSDLQADQIQQRITLRANASIKAIFTKLDVQERVVNPRLLYGQRDALITWPAGSATSWVFKLIDSASNSVLQELNLQVPRVEFDNLNPGTIYKYQIIAKVNGKLPSDALEGSFVTEAFSAIDGLAPYFVGADQIALGQVFDLIWVDLASADRELPGFNYEVYWQTETQTTALPFISPAAKIKSVRIPATRGTLVVKIKAGQTLIREIYFHKIE